MQFKIPHKRNLLCTAITLSLLPLSGTSLAQDSQVEEVVVTGSFIRRSEGFTSASSVTQLTAEDLEAQGTINMGEVIQNLTFVNGAASASTDTIQGTSGNSSSVDLRGLGASATLTLMDGKRVPTNNVIRLMPSIAIERLDIVVDGAAALYGSEAVAGVVNFIPVKQYDGFKVELFNEQDQDSDFDDSSISMLFGKELAPGLDFVFAGSFRDVGRLRWDDRPELAAAGLTVSGTANPGNWNVPLRDENGVLTGANVRRGDPGCGTSRDAIGSDGLLSPNGFTFGGRCWYEFGDTRDYREPNKNTNVYSNLSYEVNDDLTLSTQVNFSRQLENGRSSTSNPGGRDTDLPTVRGELPGNPFRAMDANGNPLFAMDANGDGIPDRDANNVVLLNPNGIPFYEDVNPNGWRPIGKAHTFSANHNSDGSRQDEGDDRDFRFTFTADFTVPFLEGWEGTSFYTWMESEDQSISSQSLSFGAIAQGLNCDILNDASACFNPFAPNANANGGSITNGSAIMDQIATAFRQEIRTELQTFDIILNGELPLGDFELPGGPIGVAVGYQRREDSYEETPPANIIDGDQFIGEQVFPFSNSREVNAWFAEFAVPLLDNLELSAAVRNEDFSSGQSSTDPKLGLTYQPSDWLTLRATWGESFIAPTLIQLGQPQNCGLTAVDDPFSTFNAFVATCIEGNPALVPESAENTSFGFDLTPIDGLSIKYTWNETDFQDRIVTQSTEDVLRSDFAQFQTATGFAGPGDPSIQQLTDWVNSGQADPRIIRSAADLTKINTIIQRDTNASSIKVSASDVQVSYITDFRDWGTFRVALDASYYHSYEYQLDSLQPVREAVGNQNGTVGDIPSLPEYKANLTLGWTRGQHAASIITRHVDQVTFDANPFSFLRFVQNNNWRDVDTIRAWTDVDAFYTYRDVELFGGTGAITVGARNLFDRQAQKTGMFAGVVGEMQDPLGRQVYARINFEL